MSDEGTIGCPSPCVSLVFTCIDEEVRNESFQHLHDDDMSLVSNPGLVSFLFLGAADVPSVELIDKADHRVYCCMIPVFFDHMKSSELKQLRKEEKSIYPPSLSHRLGVLYLNIRGETLRREDKLSMC